MEKPFSSPEQKAGLLQIFKSLGTLDEKLRFWQDVFRLRYVQYLRFNTFKDTPTKKKLAEEYAGYNEFIIIPKKEEYERYNKILLEDFRLLHNALRRQKAFFTISDFLYDYNNRIAGAIVNRGELIEKEIAKTIKDAAQASLESPDMLDISWQFFRLAFEDYRFKRKEVDFKEQFHVEVENVIALHKGLAMAQYLEFLEDELEQVNKKPKKPSDFSINQQLLVLDYLGVIERIQDRDKTIQAEYLSQFMNKTFQNVRVSLSDINGLKFSKFDKEKERIRKDLEVVLAFFAELGLKREAKEVKADLQKLSQ